MVEYKSEVVLMKGSASLSISEIPIDALYNAAETRHIRQNDQPEPSLHLDIKKTDERMFEVETEGVKSVQINSSGEVTVKKTRKDQSFENGWIAAQNLLKTAVVDLGNPEFSLEKVVVQVNLEKSLSIPDEAKEQSRVRFKGSGASSSGTSGEFGKYEIMSGITVYAVEPNELVISYTDGNTPKSYPVKQVIDELSKDGWI